MSDPKNLQDQDQEPEIYPVEPRYHPVHTIPRKIYDLLASSRLAMALLVIILVCCIFGVTAVRGEKAWLLIFNTLWFNGLLVLLVVNVACCFFGRIWGRKVTVISFGMILFHLSFVLVFLGIVYNSLYCFRGAIRLTEGEVLASGDPKSYDTWSAGRFFRFSRLKGETSLVRMHTGYKVADENKRSAYEIEVGEGGDTKKGIIFITHKLTHHGVDYFNDREGYSLLVSLADNSGREMYGAFVPLQSIRQPDKSYVYATGTRNNTTVVANPILFPHEPETPVLGLQIAFFKSKLDERGGEVEFQVFPLNEKLKPKSDKPALVVKKPLNQAVEADEYRLTAKEVRFWVAMAVRYEPGKPIVLASLWLGLAGMIITTLGRIFRSKG